MDTCSIFEELFLKRWPSFTQPGVERGAYTVSILLIWTKHRIAEQSRAEQSKEQQQQDTHTREGGDEAVLQKKKTQHTHKHTHTQRSTTGDGKAQPRSLSRHE